ncbi:ribbon-helix-helix domain-containing protein [Labrys monachus]|uniref:DNA-binding ribbon-helix-helix protein n=1 Tax=Labrys monachus TaxID=217067 RepID=A0ABU0FF51_9HYPH|nr:ribbon-helix-helix domain-containing protein [Labrys monachus]MDQ0393238.1 putative DNA-binding ribbon-helix-helix protein [Labrys monachus]
MKSNIVKRSIVIDGRSTSISLEDAFWEELKRIARDWNLTAYQLVTDIEAKYPHFNLSSTLRLFVLENVRRGQGPHMSGNSSAS